MAAGNTYVALATQTLGSATTTVTFSSISGSYTDLVLVIANWNGATNWNPALRFNSDSGTNYSVTTLEGNGSTAQSSRRTSDTSMQMGAYLAASGGTDPDNFIFNIQNYSNATTYKSVVGRGNYFAGTYPGAGAYVGLWRSTAAISTIAITIGSGTQQAGATFTLYGIAAA
jgi:hypothetical protein